MQFARPKPCGYSNACIWVTENMSIKYAVDNSIVKAHISSKIVLYYRLNNIIYNWCQCVFIRI